MREARSLEVFEKGRQRHAGEEEGQSGRFCPFSGGALSAAWLDTVRTHSVCSRPVSGILCQTMTDSPDVLELQRELRDMRHALAAMRDRLEQSRHEHEAAVVRAVSEVTAENAQLRATVGALRDELEMERGRREELVRKAYAETADEIRQLRAAAAALRDQLEIETAGRDKAVTKAVALAQDQITQLQATVRQLRDRLESVQTT